MVAESGGMAVTRQRKRGVRRKERAERERRASRTENRVEIAKDRDEPEGAKGEVGKGERLYLLTPSPGLSVRDETKRCEARCGGKGTRR